MDKTETMLVEIGALCSAFEGLMQGQNKKLLAQFREVCEKARLEITRKNNRIAELEDKLAKGYPQLPMDDCGVTWVWIYQYNDILERLHYVAETAKEMGCDVPRRTEGDNIWWEPLHKRARE